MHVVVVAVLHAADGHVVFFAQLFDAEHCTSHLQELPHCTPLGHPPPEQSTEHVPEPHVTPVEQAPTAQMATQFEERPQFTLPPHAPTSQTAVHGPAPQIMPFEHAFGPHSTAQVADFEQSIVDPQAPVPQLTWHGPVPHVMGVEHAFVPLHWISQEVACVQSTLERHAPAPQFT